LKSWLPGATAAAVTFFVTACAAPLLSPEDRKQVCSVAVAGTADGPAFRENVFAGPAGGLAGAGVGALQGLIYSGGYGAIVTVPLGALIGAVGGTACAASGLSHPNAQADFERLLKAADAGALPRALEAEMNAPRAECSRPGAPGPDATVDIEKLESGMACVYSRQQYWIAVQWRTRIAATGRELNRTTTRCEQTSYRTVDDWFGDPERARAELENAFAATGRRMAGQLLAKDMPYECQLHSDATGAVVAK
jgi:hypothetical protein